MIKKRNSLNKNTLVVFGVLTGILLLVGVISSQKVSADTNTNKNYPPLIQQLIDKFKLNSNEVDKVIEQSKLDHQQQNQTRFEQRLNQYIKDGKITEAQKKQLLQKKQQMIKQQEQQRIEYQNWLKQQGLEDVFPMQGYGFKRGVFGMYNK